MNTNTFLISMAILVFLDFFLTLIRYSLVNAHLPRLLNLREGKEELVDRTIKTIERPRIRVSLRLAASLLHLFIGALSIFFLSLRVTNENSLLAHIPDRPGSGNYPGLWRSTC